MAKKEKNGNGAKVSVRSGEDKLPARMAERSRLPALRTEHPLRWLREEMDSLFERFFGRIIPGSFPQFSAGGSVDLH